MDALGKGMKPIVMPHYPHMLFEDTAIWTAYLSSPIVPIKAVWYDVHVGGVLLPVQQGDELGLRIASGITRKRIDVVAQVGGGYWVVEIKPEAGFLALGQVCVYTRLFIEEYRPNGEVMPVIVCNKADPDILPDFDSAGVGVIVTS